jgi:hypothetical protein
MEKCDEIDDGHHAAGGTEIVANPHTFELGYQNN